MRAAWSLRLSLRGMYAGRVDYDESLRWLLTLPDFERTGEFAERPDLAPMRALLAELGDPHLGRATDAHRRLEGEGQHRR